MKRGLFGGLSLLLLAASTSGGPAEERKPAPAPQDVQQGRMAYDDLTLIDLIHTFQFTKPQLLQLARLLRQYQQQFAQLEQQEDALYAKPEVHRALWVQWHALMRRKNLPPEAAKVLGETKVAAADLRDQREELLLKLLEQVSDEILTKEQLRLIAPLLQASAIPSQQFLQLQMQEQQRLQQETTFVLRFLQQVRRWNELEFAAYRDEQVGRLLAEGANLTPDRPDFPRYAQAIVQALTAARRLEEAQFQVFGPRVAAHIVSLLRQARGDLGPARTLTQAEFEDWLLNPRTPLLLEARARVLPDQPFALPPLRR
ncbi:MAG TPA: hypothetical protein EYP85_04105 [Armatimonadetes bacterium]|nr:hypothetical protein [Armatimonadota bacterium]